MRGRVIAALEAVSLLGLAVAFPFGGLLVGTLGPKAAYAVAGAGASVSAFMLLALLPRSPGPKGRPRDGRWRFGRLPVRTSPS